jgi:hypothetical protein
VVFKLINNSATTAATGTMQIKLDDFAVTGTGVSPDDFSVNRIK